MDIEFHYYINFIIAYISGFSHDTSHKIAHSAQHVDDNLRRFSILRNESGDYYNSLNTQTFDLTMDAKSLEELFCLFHFLPGDGEKFYVTTPNSKIANEIMRAALKSENPYLIGIASHAFADTYAHQNFTCRSEGYNNPFGLENIPSYGHMYYGMLPDMVGVKWSDNRSSSHLINNNDRFIEAAERLLECYAAHNQSAIEGQDRLSQKLSNIFGESRSVYFRNIGMSLGRRKKYKAWYKEISGEQMPIYDKKAWQKRAMFYSQPKKSWVARHDFEDSCWYKFQEQIKTYKQIATKVIEKYKP